MKSDRINIPVSVRFDVFKRDRFTCQYCGRKAPDIVLNCDHITPAASGGTNDLLNLVTSCRDCNSGKSDRHLSDESAVEKSRAQAEFFEERREQIRMIADWHIELSSMDPELEAAQRLLTNLGLGELTEVGKRNIRRNIKKYGLLNILEAITIAANQYDGEEVFNKIPRVAKCRKSEADRPGIGEIWMTVHGVLGDMYGNTWRAKEAVELLYDIKSRGRDWMAVSNKAKAICRERGNRKTDDYVDAVLGLEGIL